MEANLFADFHGVGRAALRRCENSSVSRQACGSEDTCRQLKRTHPPGADVVASHEEVIRSRPGRARIPRRQLSGHIPLCGMWERPHLRSNSVPGLIKPAHGVKTGTVNVDGTGFKNLLPLDPRRLLEPTSEKNTLNRARNGPFRDRFLTVLSLNQAWTGIIWITWITWIASLLRTVLDSSGQFWRGTRVDRALQQGK